MDGLGQSDTEGRVSQRGSFSAERKAAKKGQLLPIYRTLNLTDLHESPAAQVEV